MLSPGGRDTLHAWSFSFPSIWMVLFPASGIYANECPPEYSKGGPCSLLSSSLRWLSSIMSGESSAWLFQVSTPVVCRAWQVLSSRYHGMGVFSRQQSGLFEDLFLQFSAFWNSMVCCLKPSVFKRAVIFSLDFECLWQKGKLDLCSLLSRSRRLVNTVFKYTDSV